MSGFFLALGLCQELLFIYTVIGYPSSLSDLDPKLWLVDMDLKARIGNVMIRRSTMRAATIQPLDKTYRNPGLYKDLEKEHQ